MWPEFTTKNVKEYLLLVVATAKEHIDCMRKNLRSTKPPQSTPHNNVDFNPPQEPKTHSFIGAITDLNNSTSKAY